MKILVLNGPNLGRLGKREPEIYGDVTLDQVVERLRRLGEQFDVDVRAFQSNHEGVLVDRIEEAIDEGIEGIIINAGSLTHTSIALHDALAGAAIPFVEVHISNVYARETFRHHSFLAPIAAGVMFGA